MTPWSHIKSNRHLKLGHLVNGFSLDRPWSTWFSTSEAPITAVFLQGPLLPPQPKAV
jgi:hypothetical protein